MGSPSVIFGGGIAKCLKNELGFKGLQKMSFNGTVNPIVAGFAATKGSIYVRDTGEVFRKQGPGDNEWEVLTSFRSDKTYISGDSADFEGATIGDWITYADASGSVPVDGINGAPGVTLAVSLDNSLGGSYLGRFSKPTNDHQGQGWSLPLDLVQEKDWNSILTVHFRMEDEGTSMVAGDLDYFIYDIDEDVLVPFNWSQLGNRVVGSFATNGSSTAYRLILHVASTNTVSWIARMDEFECNSVKALTLPIVEGAVEFTPVLRANTTDPTLANAPELIRGHYFRVGQVMHLTIAYKHTVNTGATVGSSTYWWELPNNLTFDTVLAPQGNRDEYGSGFAFHPTDRFARISVRRNSDGTGLYMFANGIGDSVVSGNIDSNDWETTGTTVEYYLNAEIPIEQWKNQSAILNNTESQYKVPSTIAKLTTTFQVIGNSSFTKVLLNSAPTNTLGEFDTSTSTYTASYKKSVSVSAAVHWAANSTQQRILTIRKNGTEIIRIQNTVSVTNVYSHIMPATILDLEAGDTLELFVFQNTGGNLNVQHNSSAFYTYMSITEVPNFTVFGMSGFTEFKDVELGSGFTSTANDTWQDVTGMSLILPANTEWDIGYFAATTNIWISGTPSVRANVAIYNATDSVRFDDTIGLAYPKAILSSAVDSGTFNQSRDTRISVFKETEIRLQLRSNNLATHSTVIEGTSITGPLTNPDNSTRLWARRVK